MMDVRNILRLGRLRQRFEKYMLNALQEEGYADLAPAHGGVVSVLHAFGPLPMSELALAVEKRKPTVTVLVNKLQKNGLVDCKKDSYDQRVTRVHLTDKGEKFAKVTTKLAIGVVNQAVEGVPEDQLAVFTDVLESLLHNLEDYR